MLPNFKNEDQFHGFFYEWVKQDFYTAHEVAGTCFVNHPALNCASVRADFLLFPRQHLVDLGFAETWFAAELKLRSHGIEKAYRQAFWYPMSEFIVRDRKIVPAFAVACTPEPRKSEQIKYSKNVIENSEWFQKGIDSAMGHLNVARMKVAIPNYAKWTISFGSDTYARHYLDVRGDSLTVDQKRKNFWVKVGSNPSCCSHDAGRETA